MKDQVEGKGEPVQITCNAAVLGVLDVGVTVDSVCLCVL